MTKLYCPNCGKEFSEQELEEEKGVYTKDASGEPHMGFSDYYYCKSCVDSYNEKESLLKRIFKGEEGKSDFRLKTK